MHSRAIFLILLLISLREASLAQSDAEEIKRLKTIVKECEENVRRAERNASFAQYESDRRRYLSLASELAIKSNEVQGKELAALLALQAFNFNSKFNGYKYDSKVHHALVTSLMSYNRLPKKLEDTDQSLLKNDDDDSEIKRRALSRISVFSKFRITKSKLSQSGKLLAALYSDAVIRVWNLEQINEWPLIFSAIGNVDHFVFSFDDSQLIIIEKIGKDRKIINHSWPLNLSQLASDLCGFVTRNLSAEEWDIFVAQDLPRETTCLKF